MKRRGTLSGKRNFTRLFRAGRYYRGFHISFKILRIGEGDCLCWAVSVASREGNAVIRNRCKRVCREAFYPLLPWIRKGYHLALIPRRQFSAMGKEKREQAIIRLLKKAGLLLPDYYT